MVDDLGSVVVVEFLGSVVGTVIVMVGTVIVSDVDGNVVVVDELVEDVDDEGREVDVELVVDELVDVDRDRVRGASGNAVTRLSKSTMVTSDSSTPLVPGMVTDSWGTVDEGKTSVRVPLPGLNT